MTDSRSPLPGIIFGGKNLGLRGGQYFDTQRHINDMWMTVAQAMLQNADPLSVLADEVFY